MKTVYAFCILFLVFSGQALAQLTCTYCTTRSNSEDSETRGFGDARPTYIVGTWTGTFNGTIKLYGHSVFTIEGRGHHRINGKIISDAPPWVPTSITLSAKRAANWGGHLAGVTFQGGEPNTYSGPTIIKSGYIACNKPEGTVAIPGDIIIRAEDGLLEESGLWFGASHQLSGNGKLIFERNNGTTGLITLNGTTQTITGFSGERTTDVINNIHPNHLANIPGVPHNKTDKAVLIVRGTGERNEYGKGYGNLQSAAWNIHGSVNGGFEVRVTGPGQVLSSNTNIADVTFNIEPAGVLEFNASGDNTRQRLIFKGSGTLKKTGGGILRLTGSTLSQSGGRIWVAESVLQNSSNTIYPVNFDDKNRSVLHLENPDSGRAISGKAIFDLNGVNSIFSGLTGTGKVENSSKGYITLTLEPDYEQIFSGEIRDNAGNHPVSETETGKGGVVVWKSMNGTQVFTGVNTYTGRTEVSAGTLKLMGGAKLGNGTYTGDLKISNSREPAATFEHNGTGTQIFNGNITKNDPDFVSRFSLKGIFRQSGSGKSIITGAKDFTGNVEITGGFLGGTGDLSKANSVTVGAHGRIGGGNGTEGHGATLTVANLIFATASSTLVVSSKPDNTPGLTEVKTSEGSPGTFSAPTGFTVDIVGDNITGGYLIKCSNTGNLPLPALGRNESEKAYCFTWDANGLFMSVSSGTNRSIVFNQPPDITGYGGDTQSAISFTSSATGNTAPTGYQWWQKGTHRDRVAGLENYTTDWTKTAIAEFAIPVSAAPLRRSLQVTGFNTTTGCMAAKTFTYTVELPANLTCNNCSFTRPGSTDIVTGTTETPAVILSGRPGEFTGDITLNGPCHFIITNLGKYTLSGQITGTGPLVYKANEAGIQGKKAGITLSGDRSNNYTGLTSIAGGFVICNKINNTVAIPNNVKISAVSETLPAHLYCKNNNQFGSSVVDFSDAQAASTLQLSGTTQNIAGLTGNNSIGVVGNLEEYYRPVLMDNEEPTGEAILNIAVAAGNNCIFGGGGYIRKGTSTQALTVNVISGTQVIENPDNHITNVTLMSTGEGILEFNTLTATTPYSMGVGVTFKGNGTVKKRGPGVLALSGVSVLKPGGQIWVAEGTLRNDGTTYYTGAESNGAMLRVDVAAETGSPAPVFDLWGNNSTFGGLTGDGVVQNNFASLRTSPGGGYNELLLKLTGTHTFAGAIRDNLGSVAPESNGGQGKGGIALKIEGNNLTQSFSGVNSYTGSTTISSGKLALTGAGQLGNGTYARVLEISNVAAAASQATFEHNGTATQIFTGNITATGEGAVKGIFLQSGMGKSILTGSKTFAGNVNITGGFLVGTGTLGNVNSVNLEGTGGLGGGDGTAGNGDTLTIKRLAFKSETAKLIVTSKANNTPSLLEVQSLPTATNVNRFIVDILATASLQSGYLIRYPDNIQRPNGLPVPVLGVNNTGKGVRFNWDNVGLRMQISNGAIALTMRPGSVCPRGSNSFNAKIMVDVSYSDVSDLPAAEAVLAGYFTLSDNRAKSGDIAVSRSGSTITAQFDGANTTDANLPYTIIYNDQKSAVIRYETRINRMPVLSISTGWNPTCLGAPLVLQGVSKDGAGTISSQHTAIATTGSTTAALTATATTLATGNVDFLLTDNDGCKSEYLNVVVMNGAPHITVASATLCAAVNGAGSTTTLTADQDPVAAPAIAWRINPPVTGASIEDVTAGDREARFSVTNTALTEQKQFIIEYTSRPGCKTSTTITVNPNPVISPAGSSICIAANGAGNSVDLAAGQDPASTSAWVINPEGASIEDVTTTDQLARFSVTNPVLTEQKQFTIEYTSQAGCKGRSAITVNPTPVVSANSGFNLAKLCAGAPYAEALTVSGITTGNWAIYRTGTTAASAISTQVTASATAGRGNIQAGNATASTTEEVVFISEANCKSSALPITVYPKPVMNNIADRAYCHDTDIQAFAPPSAGTVADAIPTHYQWSLPPGATNHDDINLSNHTADWTKAAVSSFRSPNIMTPIKRDLTITGYNSTSGCVTESQVFTITIKHGLELTFDSTSPVCSGTGTNVMLHSSLSDTNYSWTVSGNSVGAAGQPTPGESAFIRQNLTNSGNSAVSVTYSVQAVSGASNNCLATTEISVEVSHTQGVTPTVSGGGNYCVNPDNNTGQTNLIPSASGANEWVYISGFPVNQTEGAISGHTQKLEKGAVTAVTDNLILSGQASAMVYYIFRPFTDCLGSPSDTVRVRLYPAPATPVVENLTVCSSSTAHATTTNRILVNSTGLAYTWTVDKTNSPDVSGYTEPSREGAVASTTNPTAAIAAVADHLLLAATAAQTIVYSITPWRNGCPGQAASANVVVNPLPVVNKPNDRKYCPNADVDAEPLTGTHGANAFKWSGGLAAGLADQVNYGQGLPAYTAPAGIIDPVEVKISAKNENGCESASEVSFTLAVVAKPTLTLGTSRALCTGPSIETAAATKIGITTMHPETKYKWIAQTDGIGAGGIRLVKDGVAVPFPCTENTLQEGVLTQKITATAGHTATLAFNVQPFLGTCAGDVVSTSVLVTGNDLTAGIANNSAGICNASPGNTINIKVGDNADGNTYSWAVTNNTGNVQGYNQQTEARAATTISDALTLSDTRRGNVTYTFTPLRGDCDGGLISHTVFVNPVPVITVSSGSTLRICSGTNTAILLSVNLSAPEISHVAYSWTVSDEAMGAKPGTGNQAGFEQQKLIRQGTGDGSVTYTFIPHYIPADGKGSCTGQAGTIIYTVRPLVETLISGHAETKKVCLGDKITLSATAPVDATYQWVKDETDIPGATGNSYEVQTNSESAATYTVRVSTGSACAISDSRRVEVTRDEYFTGGEARTDKTEEEINKPVNFTYTAPNTNGIEYSWDFKDNTPVATTQDASYSYLNSGTFFPTLTVVKMGQTACTKTFGLPELKITPVAGDCNSSMAFGVFPVPAQDQVTIINEGSDMQNITIRDISGKMVVNVAVYGRKATLRVGHLASGIYLLTVTDSKGLRHLKISKR